MLPSGVALNIPSSGMEANLLAFLEHEAKIEGSDLVRLRPSPIRDGQKQNRKPPFRSS